MKDKKSSVGQEILINVNPVEKRVAVLDDGILVDFFMERKGLEHYAGSIYKGRVTSVLPGIEAAFVDIGMEKNGFLHVSDVVDKSAVLRDMLSDEDEPEIHDVRKTVSAKIKDILKVGDKIMVQVVKEAMGTKGPRVTTYISLPGRYLVLTPYDKHIGISRRIIDKAERKRIKEILLNKSDLLKDAGCIVRTVAQKSDENGLRSELKYLLGLWQRIKARDDKQDSPGVVYEEYGVVLRMIRDVFTEDVAALTVDSKDEYSRIVKFLKTFMPSLRKQVKLYTARTPLFQKYNLDKKIDEIFERKIGLKSGGYLVIDQTEGVVVVDVNTGRFTGKKNLEETAYKTNVEAAREIPRQLMLRDIGGIVIIDFIDMETSEHQDSVFRVLQEGTRKDKAKISMRAISQFGIVEMTRQRMRKSLEGSSHVECPYCGGRGNIKSAETIAIEAVRRIDKVLDKSVKKQKHISAVMHPDIHSQLVSNQARMLGDIQRKYRCKIELSEDKSLHIEDVVINEK
ncbi:MAG: Rne/Rng family ribonuclease [Candidatus Omnitrophota bacterium]